VSEGQLSFQPIDDLLAEPMALDDKALVERARLSGTTVEQLGRLYETWGLARPEPGQMAREDELRLLDVIDGFRRAGIDADRLIEATRYVGELTRRIAEGQIQFFRANVIEPLMASGVPMMQVIEQALPVGGKLQPNARAVVAWLHTRHLENAVLQNLVTMMEAAIEDAGVHPARQAGPPTIAFVDLSGYTSATDRAGDREGVRMAVALGDLAHRETRTHAGRVVKLIGDGAMLFFPQPEEGVRAVAAIVGGAVDAGLPPAHAGIHAGDVITREGDFFGRTVNVASRLQGHAVAGEVLVSREVAEACRETGLTFEARGSVQVKGLAALDVFALDASLWDQS
jgi:adenylate cyclase